ncbi:uncharacterized protein LOC128883989 isoform X2 [Hylaeus volcanicus]|uniref:uncharacterized protein LOC128883989 isoform X2 n=1 Tax=Hylaeus volcanicus TaxID=313075 RepID=UPI0023B7F95C|nr:uncharacterized protein LOC128883989 isoform X2 [Hylaeus volcanicus]
METEQGISGNNFEFTDGTLYSKKNKVCYFYHEDSGNYHYGVGHPMKPHRARLTDDLLNAYGTKCYMDHLIPATPDFEMLTQFHSKDYLEFLQCLNSENVVDYADHIEKFNVRDDSPVFDGLWEFCQLYCGGTLGAAQLLACGKYQFGINWSGGLHHGKKHEASGFCYLNDCVLAVLEFLKQFQRVAYVDIDIHHGDGVEEAFYMSSRVMCVSFHKYGDYFPGTGALYDIGASGGKGFSVNVPLKDGMTDKMFEILFKQVMDLVFTYFSPDAILLQSGADSLAGDRLGCFNLTVSGHSTAVNYLSKKNLPLLVLGGGGYTLRNVPKCWAVETGILTAAPLPLQIPETSKYRYYYGPEFTLDVRPSNMINLNTTKALEDIVRQINENLRNYVFPTSTQIYGSNDESRAQDLLPFYMRTLTNEDFNDETHHDVDLI